MSSYSQDTLERVREVVSRIKEVSLADFGPDDSLNLDSINRIALIAELENSFQIELVPEEVTPEVFECLAALSSLVEAHIA